MSASGKLSKALKDFFRKRRYYFYVLATVVSLALPFITINGNHIFLLSFDHMQLHLAGQAFDMQEFYLMPFLVMLLFFGIFFTTALGGRIWCGWACPQTIFRVFYRDYIETKLLNLRRRIENKQVEPDMSTAENRTKKTVAVLLWSLVALLAGADFVWFFVPPEDFFVYMMNPSDHPVMYGVWLAVAGFLIYDVIWLQENFCFYICPYVRIQSVLYDNDTIMPIYDPARGGTIYNDKHEQISHNPAKESTGECIGCNKCVTVCPTHIDIRQGLQMECINCLECVDACTEIMGNLGKETLVHWTSPNAIESKSKVKWVRGRTIMYTILLTIVLVALFMMSQTKEYMLLNVNRTSELYKITDNGQNVKNDYTFLFQNTDHVEHTYYFSVDNPNIVIERPTEAFKLDAGAKSKKVIILTTSKQLASDERKDTPLPIKIKAYAVDKPEKIVVFRDTVFFYPKLTELNKAKGQ